MTEPSCLGSLLLPVPGSLVAVTSSCPSVDVKAFGRSVAPAELNPSLNMLPWKGLSYLQRFWVLF